jgi:hypothetical protein
MPSLPLPSDVTNALSLADWLELYAQLSADGNSSKGDLESALKTASVLEAKGSDALEALCLEVFSELEQRVVAAGEAYPFLIAGSVLSSKPKQEEFAAYLFCLYLSYFRWSTKRNSEIKVNPWLLFEELSCVAAVEYLNGEGVLFGTSRGNTKAAQKGFKAAVSNLCRQMGEGKDFKAQPDLSRKDDGVDLVAWKRFTDKRPSMLVMFGQCAAGHDWAEKLTRLKPSAFWGQWTVDSAVSPHLSSFYVPHRIVEAKWEYSGRYAGILFDRCRVAYWAFRNNAVVLANPNYQKWYLHIVKTDILRVPVRSRPLISKAKKRTSSRKAKKR